MPDPQSKYGQVIRQHLAERKKDYNFTVYMSPPSLVKKELLWIQDARNDNAPGPLDFDYTIEELSAPGSSILSAKQTPPLHNNTIFASACRISSRTLEQRRYATAPSSRSAGNCQPPSLSIRSRVHIIILTNILLSERLAENEEASDS
ncbi:hypothetical protein B0H14DRAFT_3489814 [Mycena olivaceomarginata]|nr:hypothetical protein B0H14DRAFT_3489814 [Mycena olivaceomarginata]